MNICHVITRLIIGGAQENTILTCKGLVERGHRVTLVAGTETGPEGSLWSQAEAAGCELVKTPSLCRAVAPCSDLRARRDLLRCFRSLRPDVVHTHSSKAGILGRLAAADARVPVVIHTIHGMSFNRTQPWYVRRLYRALERQVGRHTTRFVSVADSMTRQAVDAGLASPDRFVTIRSGMEVDRFRPDPDIRTSMRAKWGVAEDEVIVGTVARLFRNKGYEQILPSLPSILAKAPRCRFVWVGDGADRSRYEARLAHLGLADRVHFTGLISPAEVADVMTGFDLLVHASRWEGLPRAVVQALLTEVPAVSFDNDGAPEVILHGETGLLVPVGDTRRLADAVAAMAIDSDRRHAMGKAGRRRCVAEFDWRTMVERLDSLYAQLAK